MINYLNHLLLVFEVEAKAIARAKRRIFAILRINMRKLFLSIKTISTNLSLLIKEVFCQQFL